MEHMIMMRILTSVTGILFYAAVASAEPSSAVAFDTATIKMLAGADPARGETLAGEGKCSKCHGDAGVSDDPEDVNIAGLSASYIYKQLVDYKDKKRDDRDMYKAMKDLDGQQMADLAAWFASLEQAPPAADRNMSPEVRKLVNYGDPERLVKACGACHGWDGNGGQFDHPALNGQHREYFIYTLTEFRDGDRTNDIYARMRSVAEALTDEEIEALAAYYGAAVPAEEE
jgi:cytochrome c553